MKKRMVFLSAGHSNGRGASKDRGAPVIGTSYMEGDLAIMLRNKITEYLQAQGVAVIEDRDQDALSQTLAFFRTLVNTSSINIDIHFNAAASSAATGTECFIKTVDPQFGWQINVANKLCEAVTSVMIIPNRGVKGERQSARGRLGWMTLTGHNFLLEICFVSNTQEVRSFLDNIDNVAYALAREIKNASES